MAQDLARRWIDGAPAPLYVGAGRASSLELAWRRAGPAEMLSGGPRLFVERAYLVVHGELRTVQINAVIEIAVYLSSLIIRVYIYLSISGPRYQISNYTYPCMLYPSHRSA